MAERSIIFTLIGKDLASKAFESAGKSAEKYGKQVEGSNKLLGGAIGGLGKLAGAAGIAVTGLGGLAVGIGKVGDEAVNLSLAVGKARLMFGKDFNAMDQWASGLSKRLGLTRIDGLRLAGGFANLARQTGFTTRQTVGLSQQYVELIQRVQMMSDGQFDQAGAAEALSAAFRGEYDALQRVVPTISQASIDQNALNIKKREGKRITDDQAKALAVLDIVQRGTAAGAALMQSAEGKQAIAIANTKTQIREQWQAIEMQLLPSITTLWQQVEGKVVPALQDFAAYLGSPAGQQALAQMTTDLGKLIGELGWIIENAPKAGQALGIMSMQGRFDNLSKDAINKLGGIVPGSGDHSDDSREGRRLGAGTGSVPSPLKIPTLPSGMKLRGGGGGGGGGNDIVNMMIRIGQAAGHGLAFGLKGTSSAIQSAIQAVMDKATETYKRQLDKLSELKGKRSDLATSISQGISDVGGLLSARGGGGLLGRLGLAVGQTRAFYASLKTLKKMRLAPRLLQAIAEAGPVDGLQAAREIIASGSAAGFNQLDKSLASGANAIGAFVGNTIYGSAISKQQGVVDAAKRGTFGAVVTNNNVQITGYVGNPRELAALIKDALKRSGNKGQRVVLA